MRHLTEDDLTLLHYGELSDPAARDAREHLASCAQCQATQDELARLFAAVNRVTVPEPAEGFEEQVWRRLRPALRADDHRRAGVGGHVRQWLLPSGHRWALAAAAVVLAIAAFAAGRFWQSAQPAPPPQSAREASAPDLRERILLSALGDHFDRTQGMLVELSAASPAQSVDISSDQRRAADLLAATRIYRRAAIEAGDRTVADVLDALERVLVEVTVSPPTLSAFELRALQQRIERQELLFKVRVAAESVRERENATRPAALRGSAGA